MSAILLATLAIALLVTLYAKGLDATKRASFLKRLPVYVVVGAVLALALSGRLHWLALVFAAIVPVLGRLLGLLRYAPIFAQLYKMFGGSTPAAGPGSKGQDSASEVESRYLRMRLNHSTGTMSGTVLIGAHKGRTLADLTLAQLLELYSECARNDAESAALLASYLDREHPDWHASADAGSTQDEHSDSGFNNTMSRAEAAEILGVAEDASATEVRAAHRRLMQKFHPDHGGSNFLAAKINAAKQRLLETKD